MASLQNIFDFLCKIRLTNSNKHFYITEASSDTKINSAFATLLAHPLIRKDQANVWASLTTLEKQQDQKSNEETTKPSVISKSDKSESNKV